MPSSDDGRQPSLTGQALAVVETLNTRVDLLDVLMISLIHTLPRDARERAAEALVLAAETNSSKLISEDTAAALNMGARRKIAEAWALILRDPSR